MHSPTRQQSFRIWPCLRLRLPASDVISSVRSPSALVLSGARAASRLGGRIGRLRLMLHLLSSSSSPDLLWPHVFVFRKNCLGGGRWRRPLCRAQQIGHGRGPGGARFLRRACHSVVSLQRCKNTQEERSHGSGLWCFISAVSCSPVLSFLSPVVIHFLSSRPPWEPTAPLFF